MPLQTTSGAVLGVLTVGRVTGRPPLTEIDRDQLAGFGANAGIALELEQARNEHEHLRSAQEHERIAADLHDHVIQELFTVGMGLQGMARRLTRPDLKTRQRICHDPGRHRQTHPGLDLPAAGGQRARTNIDATVGRRHR